MMCRRVFERCAGVVRERAHELRQGHAARRVRHGRSDHGRDAWRTGHLPSSMVIWLLLLVFSILLMCVAFQLRPRHSCWQFCARSSWTQGRAVRRTWFRVFVTRCCGFSAVTTLSFAPSSGRLASPSTSACSSWTAIRFVRAEL